VSAGSEGSVNYSDRTGSSLENQLQTYNRLCSISKAEKGLEILAGLEGRPASYCGEGNPRPQARLRVVRAPAARCFRPLIDP
jgi:hypothetical protein